MKMGASESKTDKSFNSLNELINKGDVNVRIINLSNELLETLKTIKNCTSCKKDDNLKEKDFDKLHELINEIESKKGEEKNEIIRTLHGELIDIDDELNRFVLCESCKEKKMENLINKCG